jgi:hypothetical protein
MVLLIYINTIIKKGFKILCKIEVGKKLGEQAVALPASTIPLSYPN